MQKEVANNVVKEQKKTSKSKVSANAESPENKPKKPLGAFFLYSNQKRNEIKKKDPSLSITEISKVIGADWKSLTEEEKAVM